MAKSSVLSQKRSVIDAKRQTKIRNSRSFLRIFIPDFGRIRVTDNSQLLIYTNFG